MMDGRVGVLRTSLDAGGFADIGTGRSEPDDCRRAPRPLDSEAAAQLERMVAFFDYPKEHWTHPCTTNIVESPFASVRLRTTAEKRYKRVENASAPIWKLLRIAEKTFRRLNAPHLLAAVAAGAKYVDGVAVTPHSERVAD